LTIRPNFDGAVLISVSGKGNCYDNAIVETFFKTVKSELLWPFAWQTRRQAETAIARHIDGFCHPVRRHSRSTSKAR
jgi:transposase InsO family protein